MSNYGTDGCYESRRLIQDGEYTICHKNSIQYSYRKYLAFDDTQNLTDSTDVAAYQNAIENVCPQYSSPSTTTISLEYMAPYPNLCSSQPQWCWGFYYGQGLVNIAHFYPETYVSQTVVANLLSSWNNGSYNANPADSAGTINISPFLDNIQGQNSLYAKWDALKADVYDLCRDTKDGYLSIYFGYETGGSPPVYIYHYPTDLESNGEGTDSAEDVIVKALNACV